MTDTTPEAVERLARVLDEPFYRVEGYGGPYIDEATLRDEHTAAAATLRALSAEVARLTAPGEPVAWTGPGEQPHHYFPDLHAMGDCAVCGHTYEAHYSPRPAQTPPEDVGALREALTEMVGAVCGDTGFAACVRRDSGRAYPWEALEIAEAKARAALAKQGGAE